MTDTSKLDALTDKVLDKLLDKLQTIYNAGATGGGISYEIGKEIIPLCQPYYAQLAKDAIYELYPDFEPTANTILLAIDDAFKEDKGGD